MEKTKVQPLTPEEYENSQNVPAIFSNKFYISISPGGVRIAFAEAHPDTNLPAVRSAVLLPIPDAFILRDVLAELLEKNVQVVVREKPTEKDDGEAVDGGQ